MGKLVQTKQLCNAELRRGIAESRRVKAIKALRSQRLLSGFLRNKKCKKRGGWVDNLSGLLIVAYQILYPVFRKLHTGYLADCISQEL